MERVALHIPSIRACAPEHESNPETHSFDECVNYYASTFGDDEGKHAKGSRKGKFYYSFISALSNETLNHKL